MYYNEQKLKAVKKILPWQLKYAFSHLDDLRAHAHVITSFTLIMTNSHSYEGKS